MSCFVTRPLGPVPLTEERGTPFSRANFLAAGLTLGSRERDVCNRSPVDSDSCAAGAELSCFGSAGAVLEPELGGSEDSAASCPPFLSSAGLDLSPPASSTVKSAKASTSPASSTRTAMG